MAEPHQPIRVGLYGTWGHQVHKSRAGHPHARIVAAANFPDGPLPGALASDESIARYATLAELLADDAIQVVSLCSPNRRRQAAEAIECMQAGKHVYAEKPCAMTEADLDAILVAVDRTGMSFREMANGIKNEQPFLTVRRTVESGILGEIVQIFTQKSYPYHDRRPQDEDVDGGLLMQAGGHNLRMIEQVCSQRIIEIHALETSKANPGDGDLRMACNLSMRLAGGGLAIGVVNYLNPKAFGTWGNDQVRVFGTKGMVEMVDGGQRTRLVTEDRDHGPLDLSEPSRDYFDDFMEAIRAGTPLRDQLEEQLHVTRMAIRAKGG